MTPILSEPRINVFLRGFSFSSVFFFVLCSFVRLFLSLVVADNEINHLPDLHFADVVHRQSSLESCEDDIVECDG